MGHYGFEAGKLLSDVMPPAKHSFSLQRDLKLQGSALRSRSFQGLHSMGEHSVPGHYAQTRQNPGVQFFAMKRLHQVVIAASAQAFDGASACGSPGSGEGSVNFISFSFKFCEPFRCSAKIVLPAMLVEAQRQSLCAPRSQNSQ